MFFASVLRLRRSRELLPERVLIAAARYGDDDAFAVLCDRYEPFVRRFVAGRAGKEATEDLLRDIRQACRRSLPQYAGRLRYKAWLCGIAIDVCAVYTRHRVQPAYRHATEGWDQAAVGSPPRAGAMRILIPETLCRLPSEQR